MNISTLAKILGVSISELRDVGSNKGIYGFSGRNTRIPYKSAQQITEVLRPEKLSSLQNDDKIYLPGTLTVQEFADSIGKPAGIVVKTLLMNGVMATLKEKIDYDTAELISQELGVDVYPFESLGHEITQPTTSVLTSLTKSFEFDESAAGDSVSRAPIVTVMGHVDHGKTTLLDTIRKANVVGGEAGSITQHISSYQIDYKGHKITFVDTPGHEAFTAMRARGTQLADFIILMVSAVEGPKPQTIEVIERAKLSKTPVIVAINKIDLPNADTEKVKNDIAGFGLVPEEWGGDTPFVPISAKNALNIDTLLDTILLFSEVAELKGKVNVPGQAVVIESYTDERLGVIANCLVTQGTLEVADSIACGVQAGKIKRLTSSEGREIKKAQITEPIQILGLSSPADVGELIKVFPSLKEAQRSAESAREELNSRKVFINNTAVTSDSAEINLVLVTDVSGSLEALKETILKIPQEHARIVIKKESVGTVTEGDVEFAQVSGSTIIAFHTEIHKNAQKLLKSEPVAIVQSNVIYEILNWIEEEELKHIKHEIRTTVLGKATVLKIFKGPKPSIQVFGAHVSDGKIISNKAIRVVRDGEILGKVDINELQRNLAPVSEANIAQEFGLSITGKIKIQVGDVIESIDEVVVT
jgi:translation initiation factor IF-2